MLFSFQSSFPCFILSCTHSLFLDTWTANMKVSNGLIMDSERTRTAKRHGFLEAVYAIRLRNVKLDKQKWLNFFPITDCTLSVQDSRRACPIEKLGQTRSLYLGKATVYYQKSHVDSSHDSCPLGSPQISLYLRLSTAILTPLSDIAHASGKLSSS